MAAQEVREDLYPPPLPFYDLLDGLLNIGPVSLLALGEDVRSAEDLVFRSILRREVLFILLLPCCAIFRLHELST